MVILLKSENSKETIVMPKVIRKETVEVYNPHTFDTYKKLAVVVECFCGEEVVCSGFTNTCYECGADYNDNGDQLVDRKYWGEETGENWKDIVGGEGP